jgi:hypothetical protein
MKFRIKRTSTDKKPCSRAKKENCIYVDERDVSSPELLKYDNAVESWYSSGKNHRVENGHIKRDIYTTAWFIEINTLEDLLKFIKKHGNCIITQSDWLIKSCPSIEIYDTYRE